MALFNPAIPLNFFFFIQIYISQLGSIYKALHQFIFLSHL